MQLTVLWEEILKRFSAIELVSSPRYLRSNFIKGITHLPVKVEEKVGREK